MCHHAKLEEYFLKNDLIVVLNRMCSKLKRLYWYFNMKVNVVLLHNSSHEVLLFSVQTPFYLIVFKNIFLFFFESII